MKQILFATKNESKSKRFSKGLLKHGYDVISLNDIGTNIEVDESGKNAIDNAIIKARAYKSVTNLPVIAMDDTLFLEGVSEEHQPGTHVRRVNGKTLNDEEMINHYIDLVNKYGKNGKITARWVYGMCLINNGKEYTYTWSKDDFYIVNKRNDKINPGYPLNSISINKKLNKYFTDVKLEDDTDKVQHDENGVVEFIVNSIKDSEKEMKEVKVNLENIKKYFDEQDGFIKHNKIHLDSLEEDKAVFSAELDNHSLNPGGIVHGGLIFGLADTAMGSLAYSTGKIAVTIDSNISYVKAIKGKKVKCVSTPVKIGHTIGFYKSEIFNEKDELCATVSANYMFLDQDTIKIGK